MFGGSSMALCAGIDAVAFVHWFGRSEMLDGGTHLAVRPERRNCPEWQGKT